VTLVTSNEAYDRWAATYDQTANPVLALAHRNTHGLVFEYSPTTVIDVGCGTGGLWRNHPRLTPRHVVCIDRSEPMLSVARQYCRTPVSLARAEAEQLPVHSNVADLVICSLVLGYCRQPSLVIAELGRVAKPGACVLVMDLHPVALASGWKRSFTLGERSYQIQNFPHSIADLQQCAVRAGLAVHQEQHLSFGPPERIHFAASGRDQLFERAASLPALYSIVWKKPC
jgi:malonyl-CoA O-methyltransferase